MVLESLGRRLYGTILSIALPVLLWHDGRDLDPRDRRRIWRERRGLDFPPASVWIHVASVGEARAGAVLATALTERCPERTLLVTAFTRTGRDRLRAMLPPGVHVRVMPYDLPLFVGRALRTSGVRLLVLMETELWPNLLARAQSSGVTIAVASGRLTPRTLRHGRCLKCLLPDLRRLFALVATQNRSDARRFRLLGVPPEVLCVAGNLKHEGARALDRRSVVALWKGRLPRGPVWVAGSTHPGEHEVILDVHRRLLASLPEAILVLAPRHLDRLRDIVRQARRRALDVTLWSEGRPVPPGGILLLDGLGLLASAYARAGLAFVGGSLVPIGGHDPLEPARVGRPVLIGPHHGHCRPEVRALSRSGGLVVVKDAEELLRVLEELLPDLDKRARMGRNAARYVRMQQGTILDRLLARLLPLLS